MTSDAINLELKKIKDLSSDPEAAFGVEVGLYRTVLKAIVATDGASSAGQMAGHALQAEAIPFERSVRRLADVAFAAALSRESDGPPIVTVEEPEPRLVPRPRKKATRKRK